MNSASQLKIAHFMINKKLAHLKQEQRDNSITEISSREPGTVIENDCPLLLKEKIIAAFDGLYSCMFV